jgi:molecular chaperone Hsp33
VSDDPHDELHHVLALDGRVRAVAARTTATAERLRRIHDPSPTVTAALGRVAAGAQLLAATLEKRSGREPVLTVEIDGGGPAGKLVATASPAGWVRAMVANPASAAPPRADGKLDVAAVVGTRGTVRVTRDLGFGRPYAGEVPLVSGEIGEDLASYLTRSEQTPAALALGVHVVPEGRVAHAGGYLIQILPGVSQQEAGEIEERARSLGAVTGRLREGAGPDRWLEHLFPDGWDLVERRSVRFHCGCSRERVDEAVRLVGAEILDELEADARAGDARLTCHFCRTDYLLDLEDVTRLRAEIEAGREDGGRPAH